MEKPFLEISVISKSDENLETISILTTILKNLMDYPPIPPETAIITPQNTLLLTFSSVHDFEAMYEKDYRIYSYFYDEIIRNEVDFPSNIFKSPMETIENNGDIENYIVLRYKSNYLAPMRRNYQLIYRVNEIFGSTVRNEELQDGFIRFIRTKEDFEALLVGSDEVEKWLNLFKLFDIDIQHPSIQKFLEIIRSYLK
ncbi:hypothetical protein [Candidatus Lokiarchaeum ossiferum]|uniref:hypothetical protein n=1 Tax=Candidatus Lokiarchaeum ossiferum TaxID=2951803 RepID=UPI00352EABC6